jgi:hypothetical protein
MADATYQPGVYHKQGGHELVVGADGQITVESGGVIALQAGAVMSIADDAVIEDGSGASERWVDVLVSSAELLALNATPKTLVAAPGSGLVLLFERAYFHKPAGTQYGNIAAGDDLAIKYTDASGLEVSQIEATNFLDQATAQVRWARPHAAASGNNAVTPVANSPLVLHMLNGEVTDGTTVLNVRVFYRVMPSAL